MLHRTNTKAVAKTSEEYASPSMCLLCLPATFGWHVHGSQPWDVNLHSPLWLTPHVHQTGWYEWSHKQQHGRQEAGL